jgi:predicted  nucleic acid-binding Zn-ribbon protein
LDETDREIARLRAEVAALPGRVATIETKLARVRAQIEAARQGLKDIEAARRKYEGSISTLREKISKYRDQMLAVKTNQEYRALGNEIQFTEQEISRIEDHILEGMLQVETREAQLKVLEAEQKKQQAEVDREKSEARARTEQDEKRLSELVPAREQLRQTINPDTLRHYDRVLKMRGSGIAEARDQYCQTCHVMMRPQVFQDVMIGDHIVTCDSCGRIFYYKPSEETASASSPSTSETQPAAAAEASDPS